MFEDSTFSSAHMPLSRTKKWAASAAITTQLTILSLIVLYPILHPTALSLTTTSPSITLLEPQRPRPIPNKPQPIRKSVSSTAPPSAAPESPSPLLRTYSHIVPGIPQDDPPLTPIGTLSMNTPTGTGIGIGIFGDRLSSGYWTTVVKAAPQKIRLSSGVSAGMLLAPITPVYPRIAISARQEGTVTLTAIIDRAGRITALKATSGPAMLRTAAIDAVRAARYKPYLLNGEPTEVETTISVIFHLSS